MKHPDPANIECADAYSNPKCPYVTQINQHGADVTQIKNALIGEDMQSGLVAKVQSLTSFMKVTVALSGVALSAVVALALKVFFGI